MIPALILAAAPVTPGPDEQPSVGAALVDNVRMVSVTFVEFDSTNGPIRYNNSICNFRNNRLIP